MKIPAMRITVMIDRITIEDWTLCAAWCAAIGLLIAMACSLV